MATAKPYIFVTVPISDESGLRRVYGESKTLSELILKAADQVGVTRVRTSSLSNESPSLTALQQTIREAVLVVADVTSANSNVMFELGIAQTHEKPIIYIAENSRNIPFDLAGFPVLIYDLEHPSEFRDRLSKVIQDALKNPGLFLLPKVIAEKEKRQNVFISYSHNDSAFLDRLLTHLKPLERNGLIDLWVDTRLRAGDRWKKEIEKALHKSTVAVLIVSADFLASDFIVKNELPPILRNAEERGTKIIPLIVKPCRFTRDNSLRHFQSVNDPKDALILLSEGEREKFYDLVSKEIEEVFNKFNT